MPTGNDISIVIRNKPWQVATVQARIELGGRLVISYSIRRDRATCLSEVWLVDGAIECGILSLK